MAYPFYKWLLMKGRKHCIRLQQCPLLCQIIVLNTNQNEEEKNIALRSCLGSHLNQKIIESDKNFYHKAGTFCNKKISAI